MDIGKKTFIWAVSGLIVLRIGLMVLAMDNVPFTDMRADGFRPHFTSSYQPDEPQFYELAKGLIEAKALKLVPNIGAPLVFAPFIYFTGAASTNELAKSVFIFQAFVIFTLAVIVVSLIARQLFNSRLLAFASSALFAVYPWLLLAFFKLIHYKNAIPAFHYQLWIFILSDYLSAFWVYLSFYLLFRNFENIFKISEIKYKYLVILAAASGLALLTRVSNFWLILIILVVFIYFKQLKRAIIYGFFLFLVYLPQLIFNMAAFGAPWIYGYRDKSVGASTSSTPLSHWFDPSNLWRNFQKFSPDHYFLLFLIAVSFFIIIFFFGYKQLKKTNPVFANIAALWFWSYLIFYGLFNESLSQLRYFLPAVPIFIFFFVATRVYLSQHQKTTGSARG